MRAIIHFWPTCYAGQWISRGFSHSAMLVLGRDIRTGMVPTSLRGDYLKKDLTVSYRLLLGYVFVFRIVSLLLCLKAWVTS